MAEGGVDDAVTKPQSRVKDTIMALVPLLCVAGFFLLMAAHVSFAWLVFLLIPVSGIVLYGPDRGDAGRRNKRERKELRENRRRDELTD